MKKLVLFALFASGVFLADAQVQGIGGTPISYKEKYVPSSIIATAKFSTPNIDALRAQDAIVDAEKSGPWRFAYNHMTDFNMNNSGTWTNLQNGGKLWRLKVNSKNALTLNFFLKDVKIPEGNQLFVYNEDKSFILGSFTENHLYEEQLGTELIPGETAIVEYYVAPQNQNHPHSLTIEMIGHGYRTVEEFQNKAFGSSGSCNMNVNCPDGSNWTNQRNSVAMLVQGGVNGSGFCTGSLINNTANDGKPYFLTANHCYSNPAQWVFRFNWQSANCPNPSSSPTNFNSLSGATLRARRAASDFCLVEITGGLNNGTIPANFNPYFSGWDIATTGHTTAVGIHHPAGDIKKISFDDNAPTVSNYNGISNNTWRVVWDRNTTTEGGSSGSPLFNQNGRIIGQLWGGSASCSNLAGPDYYGGLFMSWTASSNSAEQLKYWLDPSNTGTTTIEGYDPNAVVTTYNAGIINIIEPTNRIYCQNTVTPIVTLKNFGSVALTSVQIIITANGNNVLTHNWTGNLASNQTIDVTLPQITLPTGTVSLIARTNNPNGQADQQTSNDATPALSITISNNPNPVVITITTDCYGEETRWALTPQGSTTQLMGGGNTTVSLQGGNANVIGGGYSGNNASAYSDQTTYTINTCLNDGCYTFTIADAYGDGMYYPNCPTQGSYSITNGAATTYVTMPTNQFGNAASHNFCINASNVSVDELLHTSFNVYPNPSNGQVTVTLDEQFANSAISVIDLTGREVYINTITSSVQGFDLSHLAKGRYMINVSTNEGKVARTIVLQ